MVLAEISRVYGLQDYIGYLWKRKVLQKPSILSSMSDVIVVASDFKNLYFFEPGDRNLWRG